MLPAVAAFTDTYLPTVNGVTYTVQTWRDQWEARGGRMHVVYPGTDEYDPDPREHPVRSVAFPFYEGFRAGLPQIPRGARDVDVVHAHTPFSLGLAARRLARSESLPLVASYHTPTAEYADYIASGPFSGLVERTADAYEQWYLNHADAVVVPSETVADHLRGTDLETPVHVVHNGVDVDRFAPVDEATREAFRDRYDLPAGPLVGYTGRHGYEKELEEILAATEGMDVTVVFGGDGPARAQLEARAEEMETDVRFLGFLDREELAAFYATLDVFAFPSPVETEGLVALEAIACGTPVVAVDAGALAETVDDGVTGYHFERGDTEGFRAAIERALTENETLGERCRRHREEISVANSVDRLTDVYGGVR